MSRGNNLGWCLASLALVAGISLPASAQVPDRPQTGEELTLDEARERALAANPELRVGRGAAAAVAGAYRQARAFANPELVIEAEDFGGNLPADTPTQRTFSISQSVEWFGKRSARVEAARLEREVAALDLARQRRDIVAEVERRFAALLGAQERRAIAEREHGHRSGGHSGGRRPGRGRRGVADRGGPAPADEALADIDHAPGATSISSGRALASSGASDRFVLHARAGRLAQTVAAARPRRALAALALLPDLTRWDAEVARRQALQHRRAAAGVSPISP